MNYNLVFTVSSPNLWAAFKLGLPEGVMFFSELPTESSYDPVAFKWRERVAKDGIKYSDIDNM